jgi:hypothetical protein
MYEHRPTRSVVTEGPGPQAKASGLPGMGRADVVFRLKTE